MTENQFPPGWDETRVRRVLAHYENQPDDEAVAEDESVFQSEARTAFRECHSEQGEESLALPTLQPAVPEIPRPARNDTVAAFGTHRDAG